MNLILEFSGALLYFVLSIVLSPLFILLHIFLMTYTGMKQMPVIYARVQHEIKRRQYRMPSFELFSERKWFSWKIR